MDNPSDCRDATSRPESASGIVQRAHSPLHAPHVRGSERHLCAGAPCRALPAVRQLILTLGWVEGARWTRDRIAGPLRTIETSRASEAVLHTWSSRHSTKTSEPFLHSGRRLSPQKTSSPSWRPSVAVPPRSTDDSSRHRTQLGLVSVQFL